jgi:hypothetical protein
MLGESFSNNPHDRKTTEAKFLFNVKQFSLCVQIELLFNLEFNTVYVVLLFRRSSLWR